MVVCISIGGDPSGPSRPYFYDVVEVIQQNYSTALDDIYSYIVGRKKKGEASLRALMCLHTDVRN